MKPVVLPGLEARGFDTKQAHLETHKTSPKTIRIYREATRSYGSQRPSSPGSPQILSPRRCTCASPHDCSLIENKKQGSPRLQLISHQRLNSSARHLVAIS